MLLNKIELRNFKKFVNFSAQFSPGINVVKGPLNEMGKSTLLEGIIVALFYNPKSIARELDAYASWGTTKKFETNLALEERGTAYSLQKDFQKGIIKLMNQDSGEELDTPREVSQRIEELLGTNSAKLFEYTSCIRQDQVNEVTSGREKISESLEKVVTGGEENTLASKIIQKLADKASEIRKGLDRPVRFLGPLASLTRDIENTSQRREEIRSEVAEVEAKRIELVEINKKLARIRKEYEDAKALLDRNKVRMDAKASITSLEQRYDDVEQTLTEVNTLLENCKRAHDALNSIEGFEDETRVSQIKTELGTIQIRKEDIKQDIAKRWEEMGHLREKANKRKFKSLLGSKQSIACLGVISIGGIIGAIANSLHFLALVIIGMVGLTAAMWAKSDVDKQGTKIRDLEDRIQKMGETLEELSAKESSSLTEAKCSTLEEFETKEKDFRRWKEEQRRCKDQLNGKLGTRDIKGMEKEKKEIARNLAVEQAKITEDIKATALSPEEYVKQERRVGELGKTLEELERNKNRCEAFIEASRVDVEQQIELEEELERLKENLRQEKHRVKVYELAKESMSQAKDAAFSSANEVLEKETQKYFDIFTNGKYSQVKVGKENSEFSIYSPEKDGWVKPEELSGGVIDEFYLAYRLALVKLIFGNKNPPLLLDDPFGNFDSVRLNKALLLFKDLSKDHQIIIFTLKDIYDEIADNLVQLR